MTRTPALLILPLASTLALAACSEPVAEGSVAECPADQWLSLADYPTDGMPDAGDGFLDLNAARSDVETTVSGLQYVVVQDAVPGGVVPEADQRTTVHYHGFFPDGEVFDSSLTRGATAAFRPDQVIGGWTEALTDMGVCEARQLTIPGDLAYGPRGRPGSIPPNATLLFNVQVLEVQ